MDDGLKLVLIKHKTALMATLMCFILLACVLWFLEVT